MGCSGVVKRLLGWPCPCLASGPSPSDLSFIPRLELPFSSFSNIKKQFLPPGTPGLVVALFASHITASTTRGERKICQSQKCCGSIRVRAGSCLPSRRIQKQSMQNLLPTFPAKKYKFAITSGFKRNYRLAETLPPYER